MILCYICLAIHLIDSLDGQKRYEYTWDDVIPDLHDYIMIRRVEDDTAHHYKRFIIQDVVTLTVERNTGERPHLVAVFNDISGVPGAMSTYTCLPV